LAIGILAYTIMIPNVSDLPSLNENSEPVDDGCQAKADDRDVDVGIPLNPQLPLDIELFHFGKKCVNGLQEEVDHSQG
jgi:hypothetical protein